MAKRDRCRRQTYRERRRRKAGGRLIRVNGWADVAERETLYVDIHIAVGAADMARRVETSAAVMDVARSSVPPRKLLCVSVTEVYKGSAACHTYDSKQRVEPVLDVEPPGGHVPLDGPTRLLSCSISKPSAGPRGERKYAVWRDGLLKSLAARWGEAFTAGCGTEPPPVEVYSPPPQPSLPPEPGVEPPPPMPPGFWPGDSPNDFLRGTWPDWLGPKPKGWDDSGGDGPSGPKGS